MPVFIIEVCYLYQEPFFRVLAGKFLQLLDLARKFERSRDELLVRERGGSQRHFGGDGAHAGNLVDLLTGFQPNSKMPQSL